MRAKALSLLVFALLLSWTNDLLVGGPSGPYRLDIARLDPSTSPIALRYREQPVQEIESYWGRCAPLKFTMASLRAGGPGIALARHAADMSTRQTLLYTLMSLRR